MYYGFKVATGKCIWSIDTLPIVPEGVVIIEDEKMLNISAICLGTDADGGYIIDDVIASEDDIRTDLIAKRDALMRRASDMVGTLVDVVELSPSEASEADLAEWRAYRVALYTMSFDDVHNVTWPVKPS